MKRSSTPIRGSVVANNKTRIVAKYSSGIITAVAVEQADWVTLWDHGLVGKISEQVFIDFRGAFGNVAFNDV